MWALYERGLAQVKVYPMLRNTFVPCEALHPASWKDVCSEFIGVLYFVYILLPHKSTNCRILMISRYLAQERGRDIIGRTMSQLDSRLDVASLHAN
jgi:hypothetical protein